MKHSRHTTIPVHGDGSSMGIRTDGRVMDPVCRMEFPADRAAITITLAGQRIHFCSAACHEQFLDDPDFFLRQVASRGRQRA